MRMFSRTWKGVGQRGGMWYCRMTTGGSEHGGYYIKESPQGAAEPAGDWPAEDRTPHDQPPEQVAPLPQRVSDCGESIPAPPTMLPTSLSALDPPESPQGPESMPQTSCRVEGGALEAFPPIQTSCRPGRGSGALSPPIPAAGPGGSSLRLCHPWTSCKL